MLNFDLLNPTYRISKLKKILIEIIYLIIYVYQDQMIETIFSIIHNLTKI